MHFALSFFFDLYYDSKWKGAEFMARYQCMYCEEIYDEELGEPYKGIAPGTRFEDLPESYTCAICGVPKENFRKMK